MDFFMDIELQGVTERTRDNDIQQFDTIVFDEFVSKLKKAFPEDDGFRIYDLEFKVAGESGSKAA
jgi:hypothetical protein